MFKRILTKFGEKLADLFKSEKKDSEPMDFVSATRSGRLYVDDLEGYLEAGNCFEKMEELK